MRASKSGSGTVGRTEGPSNEPRLKLYSETSSISEALGPQMRLSEFFASYVEPVYLLAGGAAERNIIQYRESVRLWSELSSDPPLLDIDQQCCARFVVSLSGRPGRLAERISPNTIRKHCTHLQRVLDLAGPPERQNPLGQHLLNRVPWFQRPPRRDRSPVEGFDAPQVLQWLEACQQAHTPRLPGITPAAWWTALVIWIYNVGTRIETTVRITWDMIEGGEWLIVPPEVMKGRRKPLEAYVSPEALAAAESIRTGEVLFPWPYTLNHLHRVRRGLLGMTAIPVTPQFGFHGLRRTVATDLAAVSAIAAQKQCGHAAMSTTRDSYVNRRVMREAFKGRAQPRLPASPPPALPEPSIDVDQQLTLF